MRCPACGREMVDECTHFSCPNILCDYEEEMEYRETKKPQRALPDVYPIIGLAINQ
jgi:hypothetical protein